MMLIGRKSGKNGSKTQILEKNNFKGLSGSRYNKNALFSYFDQFSYFNHKLLISDLI